MSKMVQNAKSKQHCCRLCSCTRKSSQESSQDRKKDQSATQKPCLWNPRRGSKFILVFPRGADTTQLHLFARLTTTIKCGLWPCMFCHEGILLFPCRAGHAVPRPRAAECIPCILFPHLYVSIDQPWTQKPALVHYILALSFVSVFCLHRAPIHFFTIPEPEQPQQ